MIFYHTCTTAESESTVQSSSNCRNFQGSVPSGQSKYRWATPPRSWAYIYRVLLKARGRLMSFFRKAFDSLVCCSPPGVWQWSPDHTSRQVAGVLAIEAALSMFPYCWPSSSRTRSTLAIHSAIGLYACPHSCWYPPPQPMISAFWRKCWFRFSSGISSGVQEPLRRCS